MPVYLFHVIFWFYILSVFLSSISIFSSFIVYLRIKSEWIKLYIIFLILIFLMLLNYTIFFFIFIYSYKSTEILEKIQLLLLVTPGFFLFNIIVRLSLSLYEIELSRFQKRGLSAITFFFIYLSGICIVVWDQRLFLIVIGILLALLAVVCLISVIHNKKLTSDRYKKIFVVILYISLSLLPVEFLEYIIRLKFSHIKVGIPLGLLTFSVYSFLLSIINISSNLKNMFISNSASSENEEINICFTTEFSITTREKEIIELLINGFTYKEIGVKLFISERTVNNHITNIYQKCGIGNKIELIKLISKYN